MELYRFYNVFFHWFGSPLVGIGRGFLETNSAIVSGFSDPPGQIKEPMGKNLVNKEMPDCCRTKLRGRACEAIRTVKHSFLIAREFPICPQ